MAIIGGGLTGSALGNALVKLPHTNVHVFESAPKFSERGASVVLSCNAIQALRRIVPSSKELLGNAGGVRMNPAKLYISLHDNDTSFGSSPADFWYSRALVPLDKSQAVIGDKHFANDVDCQDAWMGDDAFLLYDVLENRTMSQVVISVIESDPPRDHDEKKRPLTREFLKSALKSWLDGPIAKSIIELTLDQDDPQRYSEWEHKETPTYVNGMVCIAGDAAHAMTPWQAAGAGQAMEDATILGTLLDKVKHSGERSAALKAYDAVRRPRCQLVIDSSRGAGIICCGREEGVG